MRGPDDKSKMNGMNNLQGVNQQVTGNNNMMNFGQGNNQPM
jgi:hypothetical protein